MAEENIQSATNETKPELQLQALDNSKEEEKKVQTVPFYKLFSFADSKDILLMVIGTISAVANGMSLPVMTLFFGDVVDAFGENENNTNTLQVVSKVALKFVYLAIGSLSLQLSVCRRGGMLDDHRGETSCKNEDFVLENYIEARCCVL